MEKWLKEFKGPISCIFSSLIDSVIPHIVICNATVFEIWGHWNYLADKFAPPIFCGTFSTYFGSASVFNCPPFEGWQVKSIFQCFFWDPCPRFEPHLGCFKPILKLSDLKGLRSNGLNRPNTAQTTSLLSTRHHGFVLGVGDCVFVC